METLSGSRVRGAVGRADTDEERSAAGKEPGIPACSAGPGSGTTPPSRLPEPANPRRGVST